MGDFAELLARESWAAAVQLLDRCPAIIDGLQVQGDPERISRLCHLGSRIALYNARLAVSLLERSPEIMARIGFEGLEQLESLAHDLGAESWTTAVSLLEASPAILDRIGMAGLASIAAVARVVARENSYGAVSLLEKSPHLLDRLLQHGDRELALRIYGFAGEAAALNWRLAATLLEESPGLLSRLGASGLERLLKIVPRAGQGNGAVAKRLLDVSPAVIDRMGMEGMEVLATCAAAIADKNWQSAVTVVEKSPRLLDRLDGVGEGGSAPALYGMAATLARTSPALAAKLLDKSPDYLQLAGLRGLGQIAAFLEETAREDESKALAYLETDAPAFTDFLASIPKGLELKGIRPILSLYLRALLGRRVEIADADRVSSDGRKIYLPRRIRDFEDDADNFSLYKVETTRQEAHLEYGSFEFDLSQLEGLRRELVSRYGLRETSPEESDMDRFASLFPEPDLARDLFNLLEDFRIESILRREYPALGEEIARMNLHLTNKRRSPAKMAPGKERAVETASRALLAGRPAEDDLVQALLEAAEPLRRPEADVHLSARVAAAAYRLLDEAYADPYRPAQPSARHLDQNRVQRNIGSFGRTARQIRDILQGNQEAFRRSSRGPQVETRSDGRGDTTPASSRPGAENVLQRPHRSGEDQSSFRGASPGGRPESGAADDNRDEGGEAGSTMAFDSPEKLERLLRAVYREQGTTPKEVERRLESMNLNDVYLFLRSMETSLEKKTELQSEQGTSLYAEWGDDLQDYRTNWARIREQAHPVGTLDFYRRTTERHGGLLRKIRREFQMLKPEGFLKRKRQYDGDDIDLDAVVEFLMDRRAGLSPSEKHYALIQKKRRDIAVALLVDMTAAPRGTPSNGRRRPGHPVRGPLRGGGRLRRLRLFRRQPGQRGLLPDQGF